MVDLKKVVAECEYEARRSCANSLLERCKTSDLSLPELKMIPSKSLVELCKEYLKTVVKYAMKKGVAYGYIITPFKQFITMVYGDTDDGKLALKKIPSDVSIPDYNFTPLGYITYKCTYKGEKITAGYTIICDSFLKDKMLITSSLIDGDVFGINIAPTTQLENSKE